MSKALDKYNAMQPLIELVNDPSINVLNAFLYERISNPDAYVVFLGETSSGKTTLINGMLGEDLLPTSPCPTTGGVVEIELQTGSGNEYYAINRDATIEDLDLQTFNQLCVKPDEGLARLKMVHKCAKPCIRGGRIFDTPGFDSVMEEHEEILKDFLPNSDVVIYTINYRIGFQQADYDYLSSFKQLLRDNVEIILVINRCPPTITTDDSKLKTIRTHFGALTERNDEKVFCVLNEQPTDGKRPLPAARRLWEYVDSCLASPKHMDILNSAFESYVMEVYQKCDALVHTRYAEAMLSKGELDDLIAEELAHAKKIRDAVPLLVDPEFEYLKKKIPQLVKYASNVIHLELSQKIEPISCMKKDETVAMINDLYLPSAVKKQGSEISFFVENRLSLLNERVDDYLQKECVEFTNKINVILETHTELAGKQIGSKIIKQLAESGIQRYFIQFGGQGGIRAGLANGASHVLKQVGGLFGKTFSRQTHNAVKHFLSKIGANSMKAVGAVVAVVIEVVMTLWGLATWKGTLKKKISTQLNKWDGDTSKMVLKDLEKLKAQNVATLNEIAEKTEKAFSSMKNENVNLSLLETQMALSEKIGKALRA